MAIELASRTQRQKSRPLVTTRHRTLTRRAVLWLGQTCNLRCFFCYFVNRISDSDHPEHAFMDLDKAKAICKTVRTFYKCTSIDIQGGEPTIYPDIAELCAYCRDIGLYPTLITNGIRTAHPGVLETLQEAGVRDYLVSLHGIGPIHNDVVGRDDAYEMITSSIERMRELGIPFRFNCTMSKPVVPLLTEIAQKAIDYGALTVNYIAFNPFGDQAEKDKRTEQTVPRYAEIKPILAEAIDRLEEAGIEANVRYLPLCMAEPRHRKNFYNYQQLSYDHHEWDYASWLWTMMQPQMMREGGLVPAMHIGANGGDYYRNENPHAIRDLYEARPIRSRLRFAYQHWAGKTEEMRRGKDALYRDEARTRAFDDCKYAYHAACDQCALKAICDGFHGDYADFFGTDEADPITDREPVDDPTTFIREQDKFVEPEDAAWALKGAKTSS